LKNFNRIARFYDLLVKLTFGNRLSVAKKHLIHYVNPGNKVLMIGGGTGDILNEFFQTSPYPEIDFFEPSEGMISRAKKNLKMSFKNQVCFFNDGYPNITLKGDYDVIASFFVLDVFKQQEAMNMVKQMNASLKPGGIWIVADFFPTNNLFQKLITRIMYLFFKITTGISARRLPDYDLIFSENSLSLSDEKTYYGGWIRARVYKKTIA
jgi:ubiquinone/menaquinone biosynthesis C-methylase UbiE